MKPTKKKRENKSNPNKNCQTSQKSRENIASQTQKNARVEKIHTHKATNKNNKQGQRGDENATHQSVKNKNTEHVNK